MTCALHSDGMPKPKDVSVNGVAITRDDIAREAQHHPAAKPIAAWQSAARALVIRELLLQQARQAGVSAVPLTDAAGRRETEEEALIRGIFEQEVKVPEPDATTCRRYYERNQRHFRSPAIYEPAHILFAARQDDREAFARAQCDAASVLAELNLRPDRFAELAQSHSDCPSAAQGGNLGQITIGQTTPEFEQALIELEPGTICTQPVATRYGLHIIRLARKIDGQLLPFDVVADRIADYLRESVTRRATAQYISRLVDRARVEGIDLPTAEQMRVH